MKIEFRKVPVQPCEFDLDLDSVKFSGTFCKISSKLAKIDSNLEGKTEVDCYRCGQSLPICLDEKIELLVSDGIYTSSEEDEFVVIEVENHIIDFNEILQSEIESLKSEYHICDNCKKNNDFVEIEY